VRIGLGGVILDRRELTQTPKDLNGSSMNGARCSRNATAPQMTRIIRMVMSTVTMA